MHDTMYDTIRERDVTEYKPIWNLEGGKTLG